eukprot:COSAG01_NODE_7008_length_3394_cov_3.696813_3_plen_64_part_00
MAAVAARQESMQWLIVPLPFTDVVLGYCHDEETLARQAGLTDSSLPLRPYVTMIRTEIESTEI